MSDDFETVSAKRGDRTREIEHLRSRYRRHRDTLMSLVSDAPSELLAADYRRVIADIDVALARLNEAEGRSASGASLAGAAIPAAAVPPPPPQHPARRGATEPGMRPLVTTPAAADEDSTISDYATPDASDSRKRLILIAAAALVALAAIGWLIWKASGRPDTGTVVEEPASTTAPATATAGTAAEDAPVTPARGARPLTVTPDSIDYGIVRKGTRVTRQYEVVNNGEEPLAFQVERSTCRCLYYEHAPVIPPKAKETLTVTIDGAKAKAGPLLESLRVTAKSDPSIVTTFDVTATVR